MSARASNLAIVEQPSRNAVESRDASAKSLRTNRLEARRERIMEEGRRLFLAKGYAGASVNEIVRLAGGKNVVTNSFSVTG